FKQHILEQKAAAGTHHPEMLHVNATVPVAPPMVLEYTEVIAQLAKLRDAGALTEAEFDGKKKELLARL
ncbi:MAG TPA: SHOCT domain-containing protein, partial [Chloroflexota bacterium]|nr:SHOCT domain-containing protein [Chloroflexota bacterium]